MKIMNTLKSFAVLVAGLMLVAVSCKDPEPPVKVVPQFPSLVQDNAVAPGSVLTLSFEANADWTVSVPTDNLQ